MRFIQMYYYVLIHHLPSPFLYRRVIFKESSENIGSSSFFLDKNCVAIVSWCEAILVILLKSMSAFWILNYPSSFLLLEMSISPEKISLLPCKHLNGNFKWFRLRWQDFRCLFNFCFFPIKPFYD